MTQVMPYTGNGRGGERAVEGEPGPGPTRFSTVGLPPSRRLELWEDHNARALIGLACKTIDGAPLAATELNLPLPRLQFAHVTGNAHMVERTRRQITSHSTDAVVLYIALEGEAFFYHQGGVLLTRPGQAVLCDADEPFVRGFSHGLKELALKVPASLFEEISEGAALRGPRVLDIQETGTAASPGTPDPLGGYGRALATLMNSALRGGPGQDPAQLEDEALGLLRSLVLGPPAGSGRSHTAAARAFIERHLRERALSAPRIAAGIGISERQLSRAFGREGASVPRWILDRRLDLAHEALTAEGGQGASIGQVAAECGFSSQSYFSRAFKARFSVTPGEARAGRRLT
jgi:AraC-like DNA-binding protein